MASAIRSALFVCSFIRKGGTMSECKDLVSGLAIEYPYCTIGYDSVCRS